MASPVCSNFSQLVLSSDRLDGVSVLGSTSLSSALVQSTCVLELLGLKTWLKLKLRQILAIQKNASSFCRHIATYITYTLVCPHLNSLAEFNGEQGRLNVYEIGHKNVLGLQFTLATKVNKNGQKLTYVTVIFYNFKF